jgi:hypothetical protein
LSSARQPWAIALVALALAVCAAPGTAAADATPCGYLGGYPGDTAAKPQLAAWMAAGAIARGLPAELPVMGALVESELANLPPADQDSAGFFQMRTSIWDQGAYAGFPDHPDLQLKWFADQAIAVNQQRAGNGQAPYGDDSTTWGAWDADVLRPPQQYRGRYQLRLADARGLIAAGCGAAGPAPDTTPPALTLTGRRVQHAVRAGRVVVGVACPLEACVARAAIRLALPGAARVFTLRSSARHIAAGGRARLVLRLRGRARRALRRRLDRRGPVRAKIAITAGDAAGNMTTARRVVALRR